MFCVQMTEVFLTHFDPIDDLLQHHNGLVSKILCKPQCLVIVQKSVLNKKLK